jgi:hypothetical protein
MAEIGNKINSAFSTKQPNLQLAWDSTSLGRLKTCPRYYQFTMVQGYNSLSDNPHLIFGQIYHAALEGYDHAVFGGADHEEALLLATHYALKASWDKTKKRPWTSGDPNKNRETLIRSVVWYLDRFQDDPLKTVRLANGKPAVELSFRFQADGISNQLTGEDFILCGHLDRVAELNDHIFIADRKTTKNTLDDNYFSQYSPDNQFSLYSMAGKIVYNMPVAGVIVDAAQVAVTFTRFARGIVYRTDSMIEAWYRDLSHWLGLAQYFASQNYWPQNDKACFRCAFRPICSKGPETQEQWLRASFPVSAWDPLVIRGDI